LSAFLGPQTWKLNENPLIISDEEKYQKNILLNNDTQLYYCVIYLSPGDYHKFHSPTEWSVQFRRHFAGQLMSVSPKFVKGFRNLFVVNERVNYNGFWNYGFFSMTAVGATNVGSIKVYCDHQLATNQKLFRKYGTYYDFVFENNVNFLRGEPFGEFNFGSTIVLIFEAPKHIEFAVKTEQKIKYGQVLCRL
jgi:phosphatidylserine decarboxylase